MLYYRRTYHTIVNLMDVCMFDYVHVVSVRVCVSLVCQTSFHTGRYRLEIISARTWISSQRLLILTSLKC